MQSSPLKLLASPEYLGFDILSWMTLFLVIATAVLAYFAWRQLKASADASKADHLRRRGEATMNAVDEFVKAYSVQHGQLLAKARAEGVTVNDLIKRNGDGPEVWQSVQEQLDALEMLACGARLKVYDANIIYFLTRSVVKQLGDRTASRRADLINGRFDTRPAQPTAYEHVGWLLKQFDDRSGEGTIQLDGTLTGTD